MQKILIFKNEDLFKAVKQVAGVTGSYEVDHLEEPEPLKYNSDAVLITDETNLAETGYSGNTPLICLTSVDNHVSSKNMVIVKKPYHLTDIVENIQSVIPNNSSVNLIKIGSFEFDAATRLLSKDDKKIALTEKEAELVLLLCRSGNENVTREDILKEVWEYDTDVDTHTVETHIYRIRQKIGKKNDIIGSSATGYFIKEKLDFGGST